MCFLDIDNWYQPCQNAAMTVGYNQKILSDLKLPVTLDTEKEIFSDVEMNKINQQNFTFFKEIYTTVNVKKPNYTL